MAKRLVALSSSSAFKYYYRCVLILLYMLTYKVISGERLAKLNVVWLSDYLLTYADVCWRMLTYAYIQISAATGWHSSMRCGYQVIETHPATHRCPIYTILYICIHTTIYHLLTTICVLILLILLHMCPDTTIYVSWCYGLCVLMPYVSCLMSDASCLMPQVVHVRREWLHEQLCWHASRRVPRPHGTHFTCFTGTKVQILTHG